MSEDVKKILEIAEKSGAEIGTWDKSGNGQKLVAFTVPELQVFLNAIKESNHQDLLKIHEIVMCISECPPICESDSYTVKGVKSMAYLLNHVDAPTSENNDREKH